MWGSPRGQPGSYACEHIAGAFLFCLLLSLWACLCVYGLWMTNPFWAGPPTSTPPDQKLKRWCCGVHAWSQARAPPSAYQSGVKLKVLPLMLPALPEKQVRSSSNQMKPKQSKSLDTEALWGPQICVSLCVSTCEILVALGLCVCACVRMAMGEVLVSVCLCMPNKTSPWVRPNAGPPHASPCVALVQSYGKGVIVPILQNWGLWFKLSD